MREAEILLRCQNEHSVRFHGVIFQGEASAGFVLGYEGGGNLRQARLTPSQRYSVIRDIVSGLQYLHSNNIIHNDLKLENVLLDDTLEHARLTDYGSAVLDEATGGTKMTRMIITKDYGAPEALAGDVSRASDVWSLGIILYEVAVEKALVPSATCQLGSNGYVDVSAVTNAQLRGLIGQCFQPKRKRSTVEQIADRLVPSMFDLPPSPAAAASSGPGNDEFRNRMAKAIAGDAEEQKWIGNQFYFGSAGVAKDFDAAIIWYGKSADNGCAAGMRNLGLSYEKGWGVSRDPVAAASWYGKSAECGDASGMCSLGACYQSGLGVSKDLGAAAIWFMKSAEKGDASGMCNLARCYQNGWGIGKDLRAAAIWYQKAADGGLSLGSAALAFVTRTLGASRRS